MNSRKQHVKERRAELKRIYKGQSTLWLAQRFNIGQAAIQRDLKALGISAELKQAEQKDLESRRKFVAENYNGHNAADLARQLGVNATTVRNDVAKMGVKKRDDRIKERRQKVKKLMKTMTLKQMATELGASRSAIYNDIMMIRMGQAPEPEPAPQEKPKPTLSKKRETKLWQLAFFAKAKPANARV